MVKLNHLIVPLKKLKFKLLVLGVDEPVSTTPGLADANITGLADADIAGLADADVTGLADADATGLADAVLKMPLLNSKCKGTL